MRVPMPTAAMAIAAMPTAIVPAAKVVAHDGRDQRLAPGPWPLAAAHDGRGRGARGQRAVQWRRGRDQGLANGRLTITLVLWPAAATSAIATAATATATAATATGTATIATAVATIATTAATVALTTAACAADA